jgi:lipopolysaccharide transport system permease protein
VLVPVSFALAFALVLGAGLWFSAVQVRYRDTGLLVTFLLQVGLFVTPIVYPAHLVPGNLQALYAVNPLVGVFELYRWMLFPSAGFPLTSLALSSGIGIVLLFTGAVYFRRAERAFADYI